MDSEGLCGPTTQEFPGYLERVKEHEALSLSVPIFFCTWMVCGLFKLFLSSNGGHIGQCNQHIRDD
jgi:hypothetical protein